MLLKQVSHPIAKIAEKSSVEECIFVHTVLHFESRFIKNLFLQCYFSAIFFGWICSKGNLILFHMKVVDLYFQLIKSYGSRIQNSQFGSLITSQLKTLGGRMFPLQLIIIPCTHRYHFQTKFTFGIFEMLLVFE